MSADKISVLLKVSNIRMNNSLLVRHLFSSTEILTQANTMVTTHVPSALILCSITASNQVEHLNKSMEPNVGYRLLFYALKCRMIFAPFSFQQTCTYGKTFTPQRKHVANTANKLTKIHYIFFCMSAAQLVISTVIATIADLGFPGNVLTKSQKYKFLT